MNQKLSVLLEVLSRRKYFLLFIVSGALYGLIYAVMTNLIDVRDGLSDVNISFDRVSASFFALFSVLGGILISLQVYAIKARQRSLKSANVGFLGAFISFFSVTCPFCKPLLLSVIGFSGSLAILKYGTAIVLISLLLLLISIYLAALQVEKSGI